MPTMPEETMAAIETPEADLDVQLGWQGIIPDGVRRLDPMLYVCDCVRRHAPLPEANEVHHLHPLGLGGTSSTANRIALCPTGHDIVHRIIADFLNNGITPVGSRNHYLWELAKTAHEAWDRAGRPGGEHGCA